jgi:outer membrane receptor protein involved in Fe transport
MLFGKYTLLTGLLSCLTLLTAPAYAAQSADSLQTVTIDIREQPLTSALNVWARQTGLMVLIPGGNAAASKMAPRVQGQLTPTGALERLLAGSSYQYQFVNERTVSVFDPAAKPVTATEVAAQTKNLRIAQAPVAETAPQSSGGADDSPPAVAEVVVTAQKRLENIQNVPASVSFVDGGSLADLGAKSLQDYAAYVPGLQVDSAGSPGQTTITLRGIAPLGSGSAVGTYVDDAPLGSSGFYAMANTFQLDLLPYDLRGVEILRGPQGTLYGASTMGGLIKYVLLKPDSDHFNAALGGEISNTHASDGVGRGARGMVNIPLIAGKLALRASAFYQDTAGFMDNPVRDEDDINDLKQRGGRFALGWTPTSDVEVTVDALLQKIDSDGNAIVPLDAATEQRVLGDLQTDIALDEPFRQRTDFLKGAVNWTLPFATLTAVSSYNDSRNRQSYDVSAISGGAFLVPQFVDIKLHKFTQELRLTSPAGATVEWMLGGFYTNENVTNDQYVGALDATTTPIPGLDPLLTASIPSHYREQAVFGNLTWRITERFSLGGGMRHSRNKQRYTQITGGVFAPGNGGGRSGEGVDTYSGNAKFQISPAAMVYARVANGYQPGGPNVALAGVPPSVGPSKLTNYETGFKAQLLEDRLILDIAVFRIDWKDIQVLASAPDTGTGFLINGGKARSEGLEASAGLKPVSNVLLGLSFAYTDAQIVGDIPELTASDGQRLPHVPRYSGSATAEYRMDFASDWAARVGGGVRYTGARPSYLFSPVAPPLVYDEHRYVAVDLIGHLAHGDWDFSLYARNLLDERAYITKAPLSGVEVFGAVLQPRTIGISVDYKF